MALFRTRTLAYVAQDALKLTILPQFPSVEIIGMILLSPVILPYFKIWSKSTQQIFCLLLERHLEVGTNPERNPWEIKWPLRQCPIWWNSGAFLELLTGVWVSGLLRDEGTIPKQLFIRPENPILTRATVLKICHPGTLCSLQASWRKMNSPIIYTYWQYGWSENLHQAIAFFLYIWGTDPQ